MDADWQTLQGRAAAVDQTDARAVAKDEVERPVLVDLIEHTLTKFRSGFIAEDKLAHECSA